MNAKLENRIAELGQIISKHEYVKRMKMDYTDIGGDGHSSPRYVEGAEIPVNGYRYEHPRSERAIAKRELKVYAKSSDPQTRDLAKKQIVSAKKLEYVLVKKIGRSFIDDFKREPFFAFFKWSNILIFSGTAITSAGIGIYKLIEYIKK